MTEQSKLEKNIEDNIVGQRLVISLAVIMVGVLIAKATAYIIRKLNRKWLRIN